MNGLYVLLAIVIVDKKNNISNHALINPFATLFFTSNIFLNKPIAHKIATTKVIISILSK